MNKKIFFLNKLYTELEDTIKETEKEKAREILTNIIELEILLENDPDEKNITIEDVEKAAEKLKMTPNPSLENDENYCTLYNAAQKALLNELKK